MHRHIWQMLSQNIAHWHIIYLMFPSLLTFVLFEGWHFSMCSVSFSSSQNSLYCLLIHFVHHWKHTKTVVITCYTGCPRRNVPDFGRVFVMLKYTDITQNTYVQSWTVTEIKAREKCGFLAVPRTVPGLRDVIPIRCALFILVYRQLKHVPCWDCICKVLGNPKDNDMSASVFVVQFNGLMSLTS